MARSDGPPREPGPEFPQGCKLLKFRPRLTDIVPSTSSSPPIAWRWLALTLFITALVYWPGLYGGWLFDDYPNIVDNRGVQPASADLHSLISAALSSPASDFKRPLASLSFAANYLETGLDPFWMKLTNLVIHLFNGALVFLLSRTLLRATRQPLAGEHIDRLAAILAGGWMLLPINLTSVLYVVQRMESMANLFVIAGLLGYVTSRMRMRQTPRSRAALVTGILSLLTGTGLGLLAKETAVMLPLYACLVEGVLFRFRSNEDRVDWRIVTLFVVMLLLPAIAGLAWLLPITLRPETWAVREFTLRTRLLSELRIVLDYVNWTLLPLPQMLSFYHDDYIASTGWLSPWTTLASLFGLAALVAAAWCWRHSRPLVSLGIALFLGCQLLTATVLPLELVYEHRNYFASFGLLLSLVALVFPRTGDGSSVPPHRLNLPGIGRAAFASIFLWWIALTSYTAYAWGDPLSLARELAQRAPESPRAQYELGRTYIIYSRYDPASVYTRLAYPPLEKAADLPGSSILPQQALIFMNSRMHLPLKEAWWDSMIASLKSRKPGVQDESSLAALTDCQRDGQCNLPLDKLSLAYEAALAHPGPSARLLAMYANYAWNLLDDHSLGARMMASAIAVNPREAVYRITLARMELAMHRMNEASEQIRQLEQLNFGGHLDAPIGELRRQLAAGRRRDEAPDAQ